MLQSRNIYNDNNDYYPRIDNHNKVDNNNDDNQHQCHFSRHS